MQGEQSEQSFAWVGLDLRGALSIVSNVQLTRASMLDFERSNTNGRYDTKRPMSDRATVQGPSGRGPPLELQPTTRRTIERLAHPVDLDVTLR